MQKILLQFLFALVLMISWSCGQKSHDETHDHGSMEELEESPNQALYDEVMKIHDEVMPKMNDIYKVKEELKKKIANTPDMVEEKKKELQVTVQKLDSASDGMMVWMRNFNPLPDSLGEEQAREYLENEMEKVKKVRDDIKEALERATAEN